MKKFIIKNKMLNKYRYVEEIDERMKIMGGNEI